MSCYIYELNSTGIPLEREAVTGFAYAKARELAVIRRDFQEMVETPVDIDDGLAVVKVLRRVGLKPQAMTMAFFKEHRREATAYETLYRYHKTKQIIRYASKIQRRICDGRLRGEWTLDGSVTHRLSCRAPNLTALPKYITDLCKPPPGRVLIKADYAQIELKILAEITQDQELIKALMEADVHAATAAKIFDKPAVEVTAEERKACKAVNFALMYGCGSHGLCDNIERMGVPCSLGAAVAFRNRFFDIHEGIREYQRRCCEAVTLTSLGGSTIDRSQLRPAQAINWPVQTSCSEIQKTALTLVMKRKKTSTRLVNAIHDEVWIECLSEDSEAEASMLLAAMQDAFENFITTVPYEADITLNHGGISNE